MTKVYSYNNETYYPYSLEETIELCTEDMFDEDRKVGLMFEIWEADDAEKKISNYLDVDLMRENIIESAWEDVEGCSESWAEKVATSNLKQLKEIISAVLNDWADAYDLQPDFFGVKNARKRTFRITDVTSDYEVKCEEITKEDKK